MAENPRIEDLRRRVQKDPASIAFAQLAEELRRAGSLDESIAVCETGLARHPEYLSARVTLGRALIELGRLDEAQQELAVVIKSAPDNLAAIRGLADIHQRRGETSEALTQYQAALNLSRHDPDLVETVATLSREVSSTRGPQAASGLSFEQVANALEPPSLAASEGDPAAAERERAERVVGELNKWLSAVHVSRAERNA